MNNRYWSHEGWHWNFQIRAKKYFLLFYFILKFVIEIINTSLLFFHTNTIYSYCLTKRQGYIHILDLSDTLCSLLHNITLNNFTSLIVCQLLSSIPAKLSPLPGPCHQQLTLLPCDYFYSHRSRGQSDPWRNFPKAD